MGDVVQIAYLHPNTVSHSFSQSLMGLVGYDAAHHGRVVRSGGPVIFRCGPGALVEARNNVVTHFLDKTEADWLWMVDSDMGFAADAVDKLFEAADPVERPIVGALCFAYKEAGTDGMGGWRTQANPTLYDWARTPEGMSGFAVRPNYRINSVVQVAGTGAACLLIHRSVLEKLRAEHGDAWFERVQYPSGAKVSEDLSFCYRANQVRIPIFVHTGVRTTHHKSLWVGEDYYWRSVTAPPATEETAVIVPVMGRPQNAEPFMASLRASTGLAKVYAVVNEDDRETFLAWEKASPSGIFTTPLTTFAEKVNFGVKATTSPWAFLVGDDVRFHPGWLDHAQHVAQTFDASVIGTNDLGNPRVLAGEHATHLLIRRSYIEEMGASWDGLGVVAHEGYRHWYVDDEIVTAARQRGVWAMALGSVVEHLHPAWGKAKTDEVYELGQSFALQDRELFKQRCEVNL